MDRTKRVKEFMMMMISVIIKMIHHHSQTMFLLPTLFCWVIFGYGPENVKETHQYSNIFQCNLCPFTIRIILSLADHFHCNILF